MATCASVRSIFCITVFLLLFCWRLTGGFNDIAVSLEMPNSAARGSSVVLHCVHDVKADLLYKVEWFKNRDKIYQYVRERTPPFKNYSVEGAVLNMSRSNESCVVLNELEFSASGPYSCEVSTNVPIFTKASPSQDLLVIQPQRHQPRITFGAPVYNTGDLVDANCTTSPAHPAPYITWFINGDKVDPTKTRGYTRLIPMFRSRKRHRSSGSRQHQTDKSTNHHHHHRQQHQQEQQQQQQRADVPQQLQHQHPNDTPNDDSTPQPSEVINNKNKSCSAKDVYGGPAHYHRHSSKQTVQVEEDSHQKKPPPQKVQGQRLSVSVSALRIRANGRLTLTCLSTIPAYPNSSGRYADVKNHTVIVDVIEAEKLEPEPTDPPSNIANVVRYIEFPAFLFRSIISLIISNVFIY